MKILVYTHKNNFQYNNLIQTLFTIKDKRFVFGHCTGQPDEKEIISFSPSVIIHNIDGVVEFPVDLKSCVSIAINEVDHERAFSLVNEKSKNYIRPFVSPTSTETRNLEKYSSDVVYIGDPSVFKDALPQLCKLKFKFFHTKPAHVDGYCGVCNIEDRMKFYRYSKVSVFNNTPFDLTRKLDIIYAGGNPVGYNNTEQFIDDVIAGIHGKRFEYELTRDEIIKHHTSYDRMASILKSISLNILADIVLNRKTK